MRRISKHFAGVTDFTYIVETFNHEPLGRRTTYGSRIWKDEV
jgi:hypothetical protein